MVTQRHGAFLVCDAAIVAYLCAKRLPGHVHLVTNNLGSVEYESQAIRMKLGTGVQIHPDPSPFRGAPLDMIFVDRGRGTRSFVTTNYYPSSLHLSRATSDLLETLSAELHTVFYIDIEAASDSGKAALEASTHLPMNGASVWNVGQVTQLSDVTNWLAGTVLPEQSIVQVSLGNSNVTAPELRSAYGEISSAADQTLVVTLGSSGAAWADARNTELFVVEPVLNAFTLGAGAVLAGALVAALAEDGSADVGTVVAGAVVAATDYVRSATTDGEMLGLDLW